MGSKVSEAKHGYPTVLVAIDDNETRRTLVDNLSQDDYNILEAPDLPSMIETVLTESRPIHLLVIDPSTEKRSWATRLKNRRREMTVLLVARRQEGQLPDVLNPTLALTTIRTFFKR
jgi:DNA-binding response OmpR family regulator